VSDQALGQTKDAGWEVGVRRTLPISADRAWELIATPPGLDAWLCIDPALRFEKGLRYRTVNGTHGEIRSAEEGRLIRLTWQLPDMAHSSTLQVRVIPARSGTTIAFHHERLADAQMREAMRIRWRDALDTLSEFADKPFVGDC
jgi:uncharacterized protein YndB with AHSA1/START domain